MLCNTGNYIKGHTIVVTPLLALMDDQVRRLRAKKINVCYINSRMTEQEINDVVIHCLSQNECPYDILLITPEALVSPQFQAVVMKMSGTGNLARIVVDEAHCVDTWGNDFRQSYSQLSMFKDHSIQTVAFTGTYGVPLRTKIRVKIFNSKSNILGSKSRIR